MSDGLLLHGVPTYVRHGLPAVEAIGIVGGRVVAAGATAHVRAALPPASVELRLDQGVILPAFIDPHLHAFLVAADPYTDTLYRHARDIPALVRLIGRLITNQPAAGTGNGWLRFHGYEPLTLTERRSPTAAELDPIAGSRQLHVLSRTFHESSVSSAALDALGIGRETPDPPGGRIVRDRRGRPTGVLIEAASFAAEAVSRPPVAPGRGAWTERLAAFGRRLLAEGIVRVGDAAVPASLATQLVGGLATVGVVAHPLLVGSRIDDPAILPGATAKVLVDGGEACHLSFTGRQLGSLMLASVRANLGRERDLAGAVGRRSGFPRSEADGRWHTGIRLPTEARLGSLLRRAAAQGASLAVHGVGNGAVAAVLAAIDAEPAVAAAVPLRLEHAMAIDRELALRLGRAAIPVVAQPGFLSAFGHELAIVPLPSPLRLMPHRTLLEAGVQLAFSSDHPAASLSPWTSIARAIDRLDATGKAIWPEEAIDLATALHACTLGAAQVLGVDDAGTLEPGMRADVIWCDADPYAVPTEALETIRVLGTWSGGRRVHPAIVTA